MVTGGIFYLIYWLRSISTKYQLTSQRLRIERGILSKTKDNIELFRLDHFDIHRPLGMRLMGHSYLHLRSSDPSFPAIVIYGIPNIENLAESLRECSLRERNRRGVRAFVNA